MAPGARSKFGAPIFEPEVFWKQMYCIKESTCNIVGTFRRPLSLSAPSQSCGAPALIRLQGNCAPLPRLVMPLVACSSFFTHFLTRLRLLDKNRVVCYLFSIGNVATSLSELQQQVDNKLLPHHPYPKYLGVTLDRTLAYRTHLSSVSVLALCYSEYCAPVWERSAHTNKVDI